MNLWENILNQLRPHIGSTALETWFAPIKLKTAGKTSLIAEVPDKFFKDWIEEHYGSLLKNILSSLGYERDSLVLEINPGLLHTKTQRVLKKIGARFKNPPANVEHTNSRFTFENFVVGPSNRMAHAAAVAVSESPGKIYNPLFIYGNVGLGKTHLMQAVAHAAAKRAEVKIQYISSENFTNELISAIQKRSTQKFREKYRNIDILLIDDIHFIAGKESTQEEFFHMFNVLYDNHKQIVLSSDRPPKEIQQLEERLVSRFCWGLIVDIQPPPFETRMAILKKKIEKEVVKVDDNVLAFIAETITTNIRELEGALIRVIAYGVIENKPITLETARNVLKDMVKEHTEKIDTKRILNKVSLYFGVSPEEIKSKKRSKNLVLPRQISMYLLRELTDLSLPEIGNTLGSKHHTTILYAHKKIKEALKKNLQMQNVINSILNDIHS